MNELLNIPITHYVITAIVSALLTLLFALLWLRIEKDKLRKSNDMRVGELDQQRREAEQAQLARLRELEISSVRADVALEAVNQKNTDLLQDVASLQQYKSRCVEMETRLEEHKSQMAQERQLLEQAKSQLFKEFELSANKLFDAKQQQFTQTSRTSIETVLSPFKDQLKDFRKRVEDVYHKENSERNQLVGHIAELQKQAQKISSDANNLASALKGDNKAQGDWGEIILERLLEQSGLENGREYETQKTHTNEAGKRFKPDVIVHLPEGKDIVVDAKVSLVDYERYTSASASAEKEVALKAHIDSIRAHIKGLSLKQYEQLEGVRTLDFVFIFIPVEAAYVTAIQAAPRLFKEAYDKNIVLVSPSSLMVALRTVETLWRHEKQNNNAEQIALSAGKLYDQFVLLLAAIDDVGKFIGKASEAYETTRKRLSDGRGNLVRRVESLRDLGAKTSKNIPPAIRAEALDNLEELPTDNAEGATHSEEGAIKDHAALDSSKENS